MSKRPGRHRARNFARAVDGYSAPHASVRRLVSLANALRNTPLRGMAPSSGVRSQLMLQAATAQPIEHRSFWMECLDRIRFQRGLASTTVLCTVLIAVAGIGFGTTEALPGDTLYSMKLRSESVQLAFIGSDEERGRKNLKFADSRLDEITRLVRHKGDWPTAKAAGHGDSPSAKAVEKLINRTFSTMDSSTAAGASAMRRAFERTGDTRPLAYLDRFTRDQQTSLRDIIPKLPTGSRASASDSLEYVGELGAETAKILGNGCDDKCGDGGETTAAGNPTTPPGDHGSTSPSATSADPTTPGRTGTGTGTSAEPPTTSSGGGGSSSTGDHSSSSQQPTDPGSSSGTTGGTPTDPPSSGTGTSGSGTRSPSESPSGSETPSATPPEPTGVPSSPGDSSSSQKDGAPAKDAERASQDASSPPADGDKTDTNTGDQSGDKTGDQSGDGTQGQQPAASGSAAESTAP